MTLLALLLALSSATAPAPMAATDAAVVTADTRHADTATGATVVIPAGWHLKKQPTGDGAALFVTKQNIDTEGGFLTGFSLNHFADFRGRKRISPKEYAAGFADQMRTLHRIAAVDENVLRNGVTVYEVRIVDETRKPSTALTYLLVADEARDSFDLAWFESPESTAPAEWPHGERILRAFLEGVAARSPKN